MIGNGGVLGFYKAGILRLRRFRPNTDLGVYIAETPTGAQSTIFSISGIFALPCLCHPLSVGG